MNVSRIRAQVAKTIARERAEKRPVHQALLRKRLDSFELPEFPRPEGHRSHPHHLRHPHADAALQAGG